VQTGDGMSWDSLIWLPAMVHNPHFADTRGLASRLTMHTGGLEGVMAHDQGIVASTMTGESGLRVQAGIFAAVYMGFDPGGELTFNLVTFDGRFGVPVDITVGRLGLRTAWVHQSGHYADGVRLQDDRPEGDVPEPHSREWLEIHGHWDVDWISPYLGVGHVVHAVDGGHGQRLMMGFNGDTKGATGLYWSADLQADAERDWSPRVAAQAGVYARQTGLLQLGLVAVHGPEDAGQKWDECEQYVGVNAGFGL